MRHFLLCCLLAVCLFSWMGSDVAQAKHWSFYISPYGSGVSYGSRHHSFHVDTGSYYGGGYGGYYAPSYNNYYYNNVPPPRPEYYRDPFRANVGGRGAYRYYDYGRYHDYSPPPPRYDEFRDHVRQRGGYYRHW